MIIVGFDQAPSCIGFAYGAAGSKPTFGCKENPNFGDNTARLGRHVREWALQLMKSVGAEAVFFEQVLVRKFGLHMPTLHKQFKVVGAIETAAELAGLEDSAYEVMIGDWRTEFYAGDRPPKNVRDESDWWKERAVTECGRRGWYTDNHNAAEACGIWHYGCCFLDRAYRHRTRVAFRREQMKADHDRIRSGGII